MNITTFTQMLADAVAQLLPKNAQVKQNTVLKNNGVRENGIYILDSGVNAAPTLYVDTFYESYQRGAQIPQLAEDFLHVYNRYRLEKKIDISFFQEFDQVREKIVYKLINRKLNQQLLERIPHRAFMDLEIVYYYLMEHEQLGSATILIHCSHMDMWKTTEEELWELACRNTPVLLPVELMDIRSIVDELSERMDAELSEYFMEEMEGVSMHVLTNRKRNLGASAILYDGVLREFAHSSGRNLYIIPSSIHELILIPDDGKPEADYLNSMVREVNTNQLDEREVLADHVYYYDYEDDILTACVDLTEDV